MQKQIISIFLSVLFTVWIVNAYNGWKWLEAEVGDTLTTTNYNALVNEVKDEFSTSETVTSKTWLWKPVYRKVITDTNVTSDTYIDPLITNWELARVEQFIRISSWWGVTSSSASRYTDDSSEVRAYMQSLTELRILVHSTENSTWHVVIEYTKTTD